LKFDRNAVVEVVRTVVEVDRKGAPKSTARERRSRP